MSTEPESDEPETIGTAYMRPDGVIVLRLIATLPNGSHGETMFEVWPSEARYFDIQAHLDAIQPGESRAVRPFPPE